MRKRKDALIIAVVEEEEEEERIEKGKGTWSNKGDRDEKGRIENNTRGGKVMLHG